LAQDYLIERSMRVVLVWFLSLFWWVTTSGLIEVGHLILQS